MNPVHFATFRWGTKYSKMYAERIGAMLKRYVKRPYTFTWFDDDPTGPEQTKIPDMHLIKGCFCRIRLFDPEYQKQFGGGSFMSIDLDTVIVRELDTLIDELEASDKSVWILQKVSANTVDHPFNGSVFWLRGGAQDADIWSDLNDTHVRNLVGDEDWMFVKRPDAGALGPLNGIYAMHKPGWPGGNAETAIALPDNARIVTFFGHRDPSQYMHVPWVSENWKV